MPERHTLCRFAPSPNGPLHLGHAYSALRNQQVAQRGGGTMLLRMENIDLARCSRAYEQGIVDDLTWLGLSWPQPVRRQSEHFGRYAAALDGLAARGLVYPCFCTRGEIAAALADRSDWPHDPDGSPLYPGLCRRMARGVVDRRLAAGLPFSLRLDLDRALAAVPQPLDWTEYRDTNLAVRVPAEPRAWGDAVLRRKDVPASYHLAVVIDDAEQAITDVVRGVDLFPATSLHRLLQALLDLPAPAYHHHRLILDGAGRKLSKSDGATGLAELRRNGVNPGDVRRLAGLA